MSAPSDPKRERVALPRAILIGIGCGIVAFGVVGVAGVFQATPAVALTVAGAVIAIALIAGRARAVVVSFATVFAILSAVVVVPSFLRLVDFPPPSATGGLRAINSGESTYSSSCSGGGYAVDLGDLAAPPSGSTTAFVGPDLSSNGMVRGGYIFTLARNRAPGVTDVGTPASTCNRSIFQPASAYFASANPEDPGRTGKPYYATDQTGVIYQSTKPIPNPVPPGTSTIR